MLSECKTDSIQTKSNIFRQQLESLLLNINANSNNNKK